MVSASGILRLHQLTVGEAKSVLRGEKSPGMDWAPGFPSIEHVAFLKAYIADVTARRDPGPFGLYLVVLEELSMVIGGAGFVGPPDENGTVEIVVELEPLMRKQGYGAEAIAAIVEVARANGARRITTGTSAGNAVGQHALEHGGLVETSREDGIVNYALDL